MTRHSIFSEREEEVIACLLQGKSNKQIALALHITVRTVEFHLGNIYSKLQVASRSEAIIKLSSRPLWESTGKPENDELWQATVEGEGQPAEDKGKLFGSVWRLPVKTFIYIGIGLVAVLVIAFLSLSKPVGNKVAEQSTAIASQTAYLPTYTPEIPTATPTPTLSPRQQIVAEERQLATDYDRAVKAEMQKGQVETSIDPKSGKEIVRFTGTSYETIAKLYDDFSQKMQTLNQQYLALYIAEVQPTPFPTRSTEKENEDYYQELLAQYPAFFDQLLKDGPTVMVYDPNDGMYYQRVIGDTHARSEIMTDAIETLRLAPQMAKVDQGANITQIRQTLGNPDLQLTFQGIRGLANAPWVQAASYTDEAGATYWVAIDAGRLAGIDPSPATRVEVPAVDVQNIASVRLVAEKFASSSSLRFDQLKSGLLYEEGGKGDIYFFRWDARNKDWSGTDWAMMPPFLQVGMSADGKLVTYINTLDLYK
jgi:DNA-binding CsgD family transcriptional regulator